jgi:fructose-1,6-bisphosphatase/inositol monophosphatase family enzyme
MRRIGHAVGFVAVVTSVVVGTVSTATAADNEKISGTYSFTVLHACADPIHGEGAYHEMMHTYSNSQGDAFRISFTGTVTVTYTNLVNGRTITPASSGPGTVDLATGQVILRGSNGTVFTDDGLLATNGKIVLDAEGNVISITGHQTGVCAALGTTDGS